MGSIKDEYKADVEAEKQSEASSKAQSEANLAFAREKRKSDGDLEQIILNNLKGDLQPLFNELRKDPSVLFMLPSIRMMHVERGTKESKPFLICNYGLRTEKDKYGEQEKVRSVISYNLQEKTYNLRNEIWTNPNGGGAMTPPPPKRWIKDEQAKRKGGSFTHEELLTQIKSELKQTYRSHATKAPKRMAFAALSLVAVFGVGQCSDADASQINQDKYNNDHDAHLNITLDNE